MNVSTHKNDDDEEEENEEKDSNYYSCIAWMQSGGRDVNGFSGDGSHSVTSVAPINVTESDGDKCRQPVTSVALNSNPGHTAVQRENKGINHLYPLWNNKQD